MTQITYTETLTALRHYDVIVAGGGVAGCAAAIQAAQNGKSVLLLEKTTLLGGLATIGLVNYFVPMCNGRGKQIIFGLCDKWFRDVCRYGYDTVPAAWQEGEPQEPTDVRMVNRYSPNIFALWLTEEVRRAGVELRFDCQAVTPVMEGNVAKGVITQGKEGRSYFTCSMLVDTTGDADLLRRCGMPTVEGKNFYTYYGFSVSLDSCKTALEKGDVAHLYRFVRGGCVDLYGHGQPENVPLWSGLSSSDVTDYLLRNQKDLFAAIEQDDPKSRDLALLPTMPQFRTTCHIAGDYTLKESDTYRHFEDSVCAINDFDRRDYLYEVPLRTLCRRDHPNLITAGRSASGEGYAWDVLRVIPPAILTGQAAAEAACLAIDTGCPIACVDIPTLQRRLEKSNIMIHFPDSLVPKKGEGGEKYESDHV